MGAASKQAMFDRAVTARREQASDKRAAGLPVGALGAEALFDLAGGDEQRRMAILNCAVTAVAKDFGLTIEEAVIELELIEPSDFDTARTLAEAN